MGYPLVHHFSLLQSKVKTGFRNIIIVMVWTSNLKLCMEGTLTDWRDSAGCTADKERQLADWRQTILQANNRSITD